MQRLIMPILPRGATALRSMEAPVRRHPRVRPKGIFCLEGDWWGQLDKPSSIRPALELLNAWEPYRIPFVHRDVATRAEFESYVRKWCQKGSSRYPILNLAFHGTPGHLYLGDGRIRENRVCLDELAELLAGRCTRRIIHFGSCGTVQVNGHALNRFLRTSGALAVCGYREDVEWLQSSAFELLVFGAMQRNSLTRSGAAAMKRRIEHESGRLAKTLGFRMVVRQ